MMQTIIIAGAMFCEMVNVFQKHRIGQTSQLPHFLCICLEHIELQCVAESQAATSLTVFLPELILSHSSFPSVVSFHLLLNFPISYAVPSTCLSLINFLSFSPNYLSVTPLPHE